MTNLPERQNASLVSLDGQAALFEDSNQLLALTDAQLRHLVAVVGENAESGLAQMRRRFGLLAWAGWLRFEGKPYEEYVVALARYVGVSPRTVKSWRDTVVEKDTLVVPPATDQRKREAAEREEKSRSSRVRAGNQHGTQPIPAASTEAPAKQSEGGGTVGDDSAVSQRRPPSGPSSGGARTTAPPRLAPTGEAATSPGPAPLDPSDDVPGSSDPAFQRPLNPPELTGERPPSDRQLAARVFAAMREVDPTDAGPVTTPEEATFLRQWAQRTLDAWKAVYAPPVPAEKPQRRQGTITRPADRQPQRQAWADRPRNTVRTDRPQTTTLTGKRHADDCSCLSCKAPKAVAK